ncbi:CMGC SRPK kinase [Fusarium acutatum]|uniref:CMGC SRPK kinase n=1 Tax=Fusarium acutatum TaxID=78861 RepID=A0A8H4JBF8_9HYPO|nr:CMGC SRPK kinase [Fusarium acutatum]
MLWDLLEGKSLFNLTAPGNADKYDDQSHLGQISAWIGPPPQVYCLVAKELPSSTSPTVCEANPEQLDATNPCVCPGELKNPGLVPATSDFSFENTISCMSGEEKLRFIRFIKRMVKWSPEERSIAGELLDDPWLYEDFPQD